LVLILRTFLFQIIIIVNNNCLTIMMKPDEIDIIVYHAHCLDGIMAAVAAYQYNRSYEFYRSFYNEQIFSLFENF